MNGRTELNGKTLASNNYYYVYILSNNCWEMNFSSGVDSKAFGLWMLVGEPIECLHLNLFQCVCAHSFLTHILSLSPSLLALTNQTKLFSQKYQKS